MLALIFVPIFSVCFLLTSVIQLQVQLLWGLISLILGGALLLLSILERSLVRPYFRFLWKDLLPGSTALHFPVSGCHIFK